MSPKSSFELLLKRIDGEDELIERRLLIDDETTIQIGRASKTEQKKLTPAVGNGWIRNPVISRTHAVLSLSTIIGTPTVFIQDKKSSHGTFVNGVNIKEIKHPLENGDNIRFGSEVMRGDETFKPPVFSFQIKPFEPTSSKQTVGVTITVPDESEGEEDMSSEDSISMDSQASQAGSGFAHPFDVSQSHPSILLGSQANPWPLDEPEAPPARNGMPADFNIRVAESVDEEAYSSPEESVISSDEELDDELDDDLIVDDLDDEEGALFDLDDEESQVDEDESDEVAQSPIYAPKSPKYSGSVAESSGLGRGYTPPPFAHNNAYWDGPFAYQWARPPTESSFSNLQQDWSNQPSARSAFEIAVPQHMPLLPQAFTDSVPKATVPLVTSTTSEMLEHTRQSFNNKKDMSIHNLINPSPGKESSSAGTKRKADEMEIEEDYTILDSAPAEALSSVAAPPSPSPAPEIIHETPSFSEIHTPPEAATTVEQVIVSTTTTTTTASTTSEPPRKKLRTIASQVGLFTLGIAVGGVGSLIGLASLPDGFFQ